MTKTKTDIGEKIKALRLAKGWSRRAADMHITPDATGTRFVRWENEGRKPGWYMSVKLTEIFGITLDEFYLGHKPILCHHIAGKTVGERIKAHRLFNGLSQRELGEAVGVPASYIGVWENGTNEPRVDAMIKIAEFLNISLEELAGRRRVHK